MESIELYMTTNPFFNRYPSSSVFRVHYIDKDEADKHLQGADKLFKACLPFSC